VAVSVQSRALRKAAELVGGNSRLARILGVKPVELEKWLAADDAIPRDVFLRIVDLILDETAPPSARDEDGEPPLPRSGAASSTQDHD
jgi:DNA-binding transcriptional regulator YdaS (Cro superfamily)